MGAYDGCSGMVTGTRVRGPSRGGKCEMRRMLGGGSDRENSVARVDNCVDVGERAIRKLTGGFAERRETIARDVKSEDNATRYRRVQRYTSVL